MRRIALLVPIVVVAGYVIHDFFANSDARAVAPEAVTQTAVVAPPQPAQPPLPLPPVPAQAPRVPVAEISTQLAGLADLALELPASVDIDDAVLHDLSVHASAKADFAATIAALVQAIEQQADQQMTEDEIKAITGSVLAELAATLEAHLEVAGQAVRVVVPDSGAGN
jgi:hypothetical protein